MSNFNDGVMEKPEEFEVKGADGIVRKYLYHKGIDQAQDNFYKKYEAGVQNADDYKKKMRFRPTESDAVRHVCNCHALSLAREVIWAEEAVNKVGIDGFVTVIKSGLESMTGLKMALWEAKIDECIRISKAIFHGYETTINGIKSNAKALQDEITAKMVAHKLAHGDKDDPRYVVGVDPPFKNIGIFIPQIIIKTGKFGKIR
jgi:hypothetical protein